MKQPWETALNALNSSLREYSTSLEASVSDLRIALESYAAEIQVRTQHLNLLREIDAALARASFDLGQTVKLIVLGAIKLVHADYGCLLVPHDSSFLRIMWSNSDTTPEGTLVKIDNSVPGKALLSASAQFEQLTTSNGRNPFPNLPAIRSQLAVPMKSETGDVLGVIDVASSNESGFDSKAADFLEVLAGQACIGFRNARLYDELKTLIDLSSALAESNSLRNTLATIGNSAKRLVGAEGCQVLRTEGDVLVIEFTTGSEALGTRVLMRDSVSGLAVINKDVVNIEDVQNDPIAKDLYKDVLHGMRSEMAVPLIAEGVVLGVINCESPLVAAFSGREYLVRSFAVQAALAMRNAKQVEQVIAQTHRQSELWGLAQIGDLAGTLIHKLNSDVGAIKVLVAEIRGRHSDLLDKQKDLAARLDDIYNHAGRALEIPRQLRTRIETAGVQNELSINDVIREVIDPLDVPPGVTIDSSSLDKSLPNIRVESQVDEVFRNLIQNSFEAMPGGGSLKLASRPWSVGTANDRSTVGVEVEICDSGVGIPPERIESVFDFGKSSKSARPGLGFGLWWSKAFVERSGGEIVISSDVGKGTTVRVRMPLKSAMPGVTGER